MQMAKERRWNAREFQEGRKPVIVLGKIKGRSLVHLGYTRVLAKVNSSINLPKSSTPAEGILHIFLGTSKCRTNGKEQEVLSSLERCIIDSKAVDLESLCIIPGSKVWEVAVEIIILYDDGNLVECASIAAVSALAHFRLPQVKFEFFDDDIFIHCDHEKEKVMLNFNFIPMCIALILWDESKYVVIDPDANEERLCKKYYIVDVNVNRGMYHVYHQGVLQSKEDMPRYMTDIAIKRAQEVTHEIRTALENGSFKFIDVNCLLSGLQNVTI